MPDPQVTYYKLLDSDALMRVVDGYEQQVFKPSTGEWMDYDINLATEGKEIDPAEAEQILHGHQYGEFAPQGGDDGGEA